ncbi:MAG: ArsB/NhaD family transporter [Firmicutes bacterium]|jgi:Na+/H+ antiporter NhaD/arsenite permease-like protein|nr:ArsB/NhaD family transporter [Bacillota bacterium]
MEQSHFTTAVLIFAVTYGAIISEKINRTAVALFGAVLMLVMQVMNQHDVLEHVDFNTIGLLIGMMIMVNVMKRSGVFEYLAIKAAKISKGNPWRILVLFSIITAVFSALLDNVTTILLIAPVTLVITDTLGVNPVPFLVPEILAANIGGTATLIGDPPNIMIGSSVGLGFMDFVVNLAPVVLVIFTITLFLIKIMYKDTFHNAKSHEELVKNLDEKRTIKDHRLLKKSIFVMIITVIGFVIHEHVGLESATVALFGGALLLLISKLDPEEILLEVEWPTIFFFVALFILVGALEKVGLIDSLAKVMLNFTKGDLFFTCILVLWVSAIASAFLDNIPFVATMIPLIKSIGAISTMDISVLWWALALGACLGGNGSLVGASANVIVSGMLKKHGNEISFVEYLKVGFPMMIVSVVISTGYLIVFYL